MGDRPVVFIQGPRQTGKTTLAKRLCGEAKYLSLDDPVVLAAASQDPSGFVAGLPHGAAIDEVQQMPSLLRVIKASVDRDRRPGRFVLTGSANPLFLPKVADSLAGRMEIFTLWPLAQSEMGPHRAGGAASVISRLFGKKLDLPSARGIGPGPLIERMLAGGFPEPAVSLAKARRAPWFRSYLGPVLSKDVRDLALIEDVIALPRLLSLLAARTSGLLNYADVGRSLGLPQTTLKRYFALLEATFLVHTIQPWYANVGLRLAKTPKVHLTDTGLAAHLLAADADRVAADGSMRGSLFETFVVNEFLKHAAWMDAPPSLLHFRTHAGGEVDLVLEDASGRVVAIEVKAAATVKGPDVAGIRELASVCGNKFVRGVVLYTGGAVVPFAENIHAVPVGVLWEG